MRYRVEYRPEVHDDLEDVPRNMLDRIERAVEQRLVTQPAAYGERLRSLLLGPQVTEASKVRRDVLKKIGPQIETFIRTRLKNIDVQIAIAPVGNSLRGYASDESDTEYIIYILHRAIFKVYQTMLNNLSLPFNRPNQRHFKYSPVTGGYTFKSGKCKKTALK